MMAMMEMDDYYQDIDKLENRGRSDGKPVSINDDLSLQNTTNTSTASDRIHSRWNNQRIWITKRKKSTQGIFNCPFSIYSVQIETDGGRIL